MDFTPGLKAFFNFMFSFMIIIMIIETEIHYFYTCIYRARYYLKLLWFVFSPFRFKVIFRFLSNVTGDFPFDFDNVFFLSDPVRKRYTGTY